MKVRLDQIHDEPFTWEETLSFPLAELGEQELAGLSDVDVQGRIVPSDAGLYLTARLRYEQTVICDRCLVETVEPVAAEIELIIVRGPHAGGGGEHQLGEEELGILHVEGDVLETAPLVEEQVHLNLPMKPLCRPDCLGLCPSCGADLNQGRCECSTEATDPRWAALAALKGPQA